MLRLVEGSGAPEVCETVPDVMVSELLLFNFCSCFVLAALPQAGPSHGCVCLPSSLLSLPSLPRAHTVHACTQMHDLSLQNSHEARRSILWQLNKAGLEKAKLIFGILQFSIHTQPPCSEVSPTLPQVWDLNPFPFISLRFVTPVSCRGCLKGIWFFPDDVCLTDPN